MAMDERMELMSIPNTWRSGMHLAAVCESTCVMEHNMPGCMHAYNGMMQCQLVEHTITKFPSFTTCTAFLKNLDP